MSKMKLMLLSGACALAVGATTGAQAAATKVYGGGSSLISVYMVQAFNCYGNPQQLIIRSPLSLKTINPFNYTGTKGTPQDCASEHVVTNASLFYDSASSGVGIAGIFSHDPSSTAPNGYGDIDPNTGGEQDMPAISFGMSDAGLSSTDVGFYNNGNDDQGPTNTCTVKEQNVCVVAPGETAHPPTTYPNPAQSYGALVQFPVSVDPIAFAYDPTYKKVTSADGTTTTSYHFNIKFAHADGSGGLRLDKTAYCTIFNGIAAGNPITNWNDSRLKALNGGTSLMDPTDPDPSDWNNNGVTLQIAGRGDSSGTTSIFTRHLARVCGTTGINLPNNQYADGATTLPVSLQGGTFDGTNATGVVVGKFTLATGSGNLAKYVAFTAIPGAGQTLKQGNMAYIGADFVAPANEINGTNAFNLNSADLKNESNKWVAATGANAASAFGSIAPPQSNANGKYDGSGCANASAHCRAHPYDWVEPVSKTSLLAAPTGKTAYPVVGTTNVLLYTCYHNAKVASTVKKFFTWYIKNDVVQEVPDGLLTKNGLASLPTSWRTAINETFLTNGSGLNLTIDKSGAGVCTGVNGG
ncbi:MAG: substrate-binding domain-containing protein [Alphaproteobacteria bacterium]|nr:substrate-binding domain-containing protein [Alphaproteobacteria bacterium]